MAFVTCSQFKSSQKKQNDEIEKLKKLTGEMISADEELLDKSDKDHQAGKITVERIKKAIGELPVVVDEASGLKGNGATENPLSFNLLENGGLVVNEKNQVIIDPAYTNDRDSKAVEEGDRGRDEGKDYTDEKLRELKQNGAKVYVNGPITGDGTTNNRLGLNFNTDDFEVLADGSLTLKVKTPVSFTTFDSNYKLGFHTFTGFTKANSPQFVKGVPVNIHSEEHEQNRALTANEQEGGEYDFNGYYIASENQLDVWLSGVDGTVWKITNDVGVNADGSVKDPNAWGKWQKLDNNNSVTNEMVYRLQEQMNSNNQKDQAQDAEIEKLKQKNTAQDLKDQEQDRRLDALEALNNTLCTIDVKQVSSYTLVDTDNTVISSGGVITVPDNITVGRVFTVIQKGTAEVRIAGTGVIAPYGGTLTLAGQNSAVTVLKTSANEVRVFGHTKTV